MVPNQKSTTALIVETYIKDANKALKAGDLDQATTHLKEAFEEANGSLSDQAGEIRTMLKEFSDRLVGQVPPNFPEARQALSLLVDLKLQDDQVWIWRRDLALTQAKALLDQKRVPDAFQIFENLIAGPEATARQDNLKSEISPIIYDSITNYANQKQWESLSQTVKQLKSLWQSDAELSRFLETFYVAVAQAPENYESRIAILQAELRRWKSWTVALAVLLAITIVVYGVVIFS